MEWGVYAVPTGFIALLILLVWFALTNKRIKQENKFLKQILQTKDMTISNLEASRVSVKEVVENFVIADKVVSALKTGKSREEVAKLFAIPVERIETIVKLDKIKNTQ